MSGWIFFEARYGVNTVNVEIYTNSGCLVTGLLAALEIPISVDDGYSAVAQGMIQDPLNFQHSALAYVTDTVGAESNRVCVQVF